MEGVKGELLPCGVAAPRSFFMRKHAAIAETAPGRAHLYACKVQCVILYMEVDRKQVHLCTRKIGADIDEFCYLQDAKNEIT